MRSHGYWSWTEDEALQQKWSVKQLITRRIDKGGLSLVCHADDAVAQPKTRSLGKVSGTKWQVIFKGTLYQNISWLQDEVTLIIAASSTSEIRTPFWWKVSYEAFYQGCLLIKLSKMDNGRVIQQTTSFSFLSEEETSHISFYWRVRHQHPCWSWDAKCSGIVQGAGIFGLLARRSLAGMALEMKSISLCTSL